jgi:Gas vesicle synthesis protein GvpL/GvpF
MMASDRTGTYVYCIVHASRRPSLNRGVSGLPDAAAPQIVAVGPRLFLIVASVPLDVYGAGALEPRLRNLDWVASVAIAHERLVEQLARRRSHVVIPMKLFTMFSSVESAAAHIRRRGTALAGIVRRIADCEEWGIRVTRDVEPKASRVANRPIDSGTAYLTARKAARDAVREARGESQAAADAAFLQLRRVSRDVRRRHMERDGGTNPPILDAAFLVRREGRAAFKSEVRRQAARCARSGARLVLTGPWPAYNFVDVSGGRR